MKKTSLLDIAKSLGVSKTLVSMVLNNQGDLHGINSDTQKRVKDKAKELNYKPNPMARGLRTGKTNTIGLVVADIANPFYAKMARAIEDYAFKKGYNLIFASSDENAEREKALVSMLRDRQVDGIIVTTTLKDNDISMYEVLAKEKYPFVFIDRYIPSFNCDFVIEDNEKGAFDLTTHLIKSGKKKIALFTISPSHLSSINDRIKGYKAALHAHGMSESEELIVEIPFDDVEKSTNKALKELIEKGDAILTLNNNLASACLKYFKENNIKIPEDLFFASYDNVEWFEYSSPTITGVGQPIQQIGEKSVEILLSQINKKDGESRDIENSSLRSKLVIRESSEIK